VKFTFANFEPRNGAVCVARSSHLTSVPYEYEYHRQSKVQYPALARHQKSLHASHPTYANRALIDMCRIYARWNRTPISPNETCICETMLVDLQTRNLMLDLTPRRLSCNYSTPQTMRKHPSQATMSWTYNLTAFRSSPPFWMVRELTSHSYHSSFHESSMNGSCTSPRQRMCSAPTTNPPAEPGVSSIARTTSLREG
jgi:hypothetical protein